MNRVIEDDRTPEHLPAGRGHIHIYVVAPGHPYHEQG